MCEEQREAEDVRRDRSGNWEVLSWTLAVREGERVARKAVKGQADCVLFAFSILM